MARKSQVLFAVCFLYLLSESAVRSYEWNRDLVDNEVEGRRLAQDIDRLLANDSISDSDKASINAVVRSELAAGEWLKKGNVPAQAMSPGISSFSFNRRMPSGVSGVVCRQDCCKVVVPPEVKRQARAVSYSCTTYYRQRYTYKCGLFNWWRCVGHRTKSRRGTCYRTDIQYYHVNRPCPEEHKTCCEGFFWFQNCCIHIERLQEIIEEIKRKNQLDK